MIPPPYPRDQISGLSLARAVTSSPVIGLELCYNLSTRKSMPAEDQWSLSLLILDFMLILRALSREPFGFNIVLFIAFESL